MIVMMKIKSLSLTYRGVNLSALVGITFANQKKTSKGNPVLQLRTTTTTPPPNKQKKTNKKTSDSILLSITMIKLKLKDEAAQVDLIGRGSTGERGGGEN